MDEVVVLLAADVYSLKLENGFSLLQRGREGGGLACHGLAQVGELGGARGGVRPPR